MTDRIDLDDIDTDDDEGSEANYGDWLWRGEGSPDEEPDPPTWATAEADADGPVPRVPREDEDKPAGVPVDRGGSGAGATVGDAPDDARPMASGPHGGGIDDMTMALTYGAVSALADPQLVVVSAREWVDWVGVVGDVSAPAITKLQRENGIDADFFNGTGTGPAERLTDIGETSMFYAERLVVVGIAEDEWIAEEAGWEFVPLETAAEKAGWDLE
ncbi:hypothetical protein U4E84_04565 [Halorubrum sp. AD140]|uniref:DUF7124 domain-containing protein n=1 Tax=Halorubrum sp. AD140 TaxID=3050073 RepID=UPI002ACC498B|nr:hypothetical protein [Halorubrum sp. AD140]MDZ5810618.1 hypothetical protein [Halorubrum sp. AD140]